jgi:ABC-type glycerol-3-phosphate transport system substrate-binding protein
MTWVKRIIFSLLILAGLAFVIYGSPRRDDHIPADFVVIRYWEKWVGNEGAQMQEIVDDFNRTVGREKRIFVKYMSMSNVDKKTLVAISAGVPPDIAGLWDQQVAQFAALGAVEPLDDLAAAHGITDQTYTPVYWNGCRYDGKLYGLVSTPAAIALHYNKKVFQENAAQLRAAGLDPDRPPRTLEELDRYAEILTKRGPYGRIDRAGYLPLQSWYVPFTSYWFGTEIFDSEDPKISAHVAPVRPRVRVDSELLAQAGNQAGAGFHHLAPAGQFRHAAEPVPHRHAHHAAAGPVAGELHRPPQPGNVARARAEGIRSRR